MIVTTCTARGRVVAANNAGCVGTWRLTSHRQIGYPMLGALALVLVVSVAAAGLPGSGAAA